VETIVALATNFVRIRILIGFVTNLGCGSKGVLVKRNLSRSSRIPIATTKVVKTPQMVFTNPKMTTHVNMTAYRPSMNLVIAGRYKSVDARNLGKGYREPFIVTTRIFDNKNGHYVRPNMVALKYHDFKKYVDPYVHVRVFNSVVKANRETFEKISSICLVIL
jgi:hypothetical protein